MEYERGSWAKWPEGMPGDADVPNREAGPRLEAFCGKIPCLFARGLWQRMSAMEFITVLAQDFREFFRLETPVALHIERLLCEMEIAVVKGGNGVGESESVDYDAVAGQWTVYIPDYAGSREAIFLLRGVFAALFWRCWGRVPWWREWYRATGMHSIPRLANCFAYALMLPPAEFRERAQQCGLNLWQLAYAFRATPSACFYALRRFVRFPFPYFTARIDFSGVPDQQRFLFEAGSVRACVWGKFVANPISAEARTVEAVELLRGFPGRGTLIEASGVLVEAMREKRPMLKRTRRVLDISLPQPVCLVARPNAAGTQLFLQAVPLAQQAFLMDEALRGQQHVRAGIRAAELP